MSVFTLGALETKRMDKKTAKRVFNEALDNGVNFIDTAPEYKNSEEFIGKTISHRRDEYLIATKCGNNLNKTGPSILYSREVFISNLHRSLKLLKTDYIDIWQLHGLMPDRLPNGESDELVQLMLDIKKAGKIRYIGATFRNGGPGEELYPAGYGFNCVKSFIDWKVFDTIQIVYGGLTRKSEIAISRAAEKGFGIMARGVVRKFNDDYDMLLEKYHNHH